ncbi:DEAD/DEAH box helicase [Drepanopeziza brunnea f. sp. 'multigermtubi' MB_m1]|uniref:DEAD/DEAH box helicase n=1 Tax=Marssonina brunnea f. sp. multigermtubi (strain MB_m1) TaxID=1072389 RepID=K1X256_MARBU|nr:DEAD/DEAH box helicase [Drepanopeziza brunnea f. sp. 'multigermtubi' MB_m1]EKD19301.1 DEAD/DEAH box helicase [Drepanopeziza brunnea f. sp. 'multigermtubi' MB_m1]
MNSNVNKNKTLNYVASTTRHTTTINAQTSVSRAGLKRTFDDFQDKQKNSNPFALSDVIDGREFRRPTFQSSTTKVLQAGTVHDVFDRSGSSEYSQRKVLALTPSVNANPMLDLSHRAYGLPPKLTHNLQSLGIKSIYPWQSECLLRSGALEGEANLVYTAPTGGGKSLVADILMLKKVIGSSGKKALLVLPYVALVQEKLKWLRKVVEGIPKNTIRVVGFFGGSKAKSTWHDMEIAVCTIEKANSLINAALEENTLGNLGVVVMDELHMIDDEGRGYILELMATKLLCLDQHVQLIGMSATLNVFLPQPEEVVPFIMERRRELLSELRSTNTGLDQVLEKTVPVGVAFHHAGLTTEERDLIATAFDEGVIKVIVATCSLAAGINLPARRVILHGARMGADLVGPSMLRQMRGRAGRKGKDEIGETYLCCQKSDLEDVAELIEAELPSVESCLLPDKKGIKRALLEIIATNMATSDESVDDYMRKTLLYHSIDHKELATLVETTIKELEEDQLLHRTDSGYEASLLGQAIVSSSLTPEDGLFVHKELQKALQAFVMDGEMHVLYSFTPVQSAQTSINWQKFRKEMEFFDESNMRALEFVGLKPSIINKMRLTGTRAQGGTMKESTPQEIDTARIYRRFYTALQLRDLCNEMPIHAVARKYDIARGMVQNLAQTCHGFAAGMVKFCERMKWGALAVVLDHFSDRLRAGAKPDLLALAQVTYVKSRTARVFWENGFRTVAALAAADVKDIWPILLMAQPKKLKTHDYDEAKFHEKLLNKANVICASATRIWEKQMQEELEEEMLEY